MDNKTDINGILMSQLDKIEAKVDKIDGRLLVIDKTLVKQEANLKEHMRRTDLLENDLRPIKTHVAMIQGALKLIGLIALLTTIIKFFFG